MVRLRFSTSSPSKWSNSVEPFVELQKIATYLLNTAERERLRDARGEDECELAGRSVAARAQLRPPRRGGPVRRPLLGTPLLPGQCR